MLARASSERGNAYFPCAAVAAQSELAGWHYFLQPSKNSFFCWQQLETVPLSSARRRPLTHSNLQATWQSALSLSYRGTAQHASYIRSSTECSAVPPAMLQPCRASGAAPGRMPLGRRRRPQLVPADQLAAAQRAIPCVMQHVCRQPISSLCARRPNVSTCPAQPAARVHIVCQSQRQ